MLTPNLSANSLANPVKSSSLSTRGVKPYSDDLFYSVGRDYTFDSKITGEIENGLLKLSQPIGFKWFGEGYNLINTDGIDVVVRSVIDSSTLSVSKKNGERHVSPTVIGITELHSDGDTIFDVLDNILNTDLIGFGSSNTRLNVAVHKEGVEDDIIIGDFNTDEFNYINIYASKQYRLKYTINGIECPSSISIDGFRINNTATTSFDGKYASISRCIVKGTGATNELFDISGSDIISFVYNAVKDINRGVKVGGGTNVFANNSFVNGTDAVVTSIAGADAYFYNNVIATTSTTTAVGVVEAKGNITKDGLFTAPDNATESVSFIDPSNDIYYISTGNIDTAVSIACDNYSGVNEDLYGKKIIANSVGASLTLNFVNFTAGTTSETMPSGNFSISNGLATFDTPLTGNYVVAGNVVEFDSGKTVLLYYKISDTEWYVTSMTGGNPVSATNEAYTMTIRSATISDALLHVTPGDSFHTINVLSGQGNTVVDVKAISDTSYLKIRTPYLPHECNKSFRFDKRVTDKDVKIDGFIVKSHNITLEGLCISNSENAILVEGGNNLSLIGNFIHDSKGILIDKYDDYDYQNISEDFNLIEKNIIVNTNGNAITVYHSTYDSSEVVFNTSGHSDVKVTAKVSGVNSDEYVVNISDSGVAGKNVIYWLPGRVDIDVFDNSNAVYHEYGEKWGEVEVAAGTTPVFSKLFKDANSITKTRQRDVDSVYYINRNTIYNAEYGIHIESVAYEYTNRAYVVNNIITGCSKDSFTKNTPYNSIVMLSNVFDSSSSSEVMSIVQDTVFKDKANDLLLLTPFDEEYCNIHGSLKGALDPEDANIKAVSLGDNAEYKGSATSISVSDGLANFDMQPDKKIGVGMVVSTSSGDYILRDKISVKRWVITDANGVRINTLAASTINNVHHAANDIATINADTTDLFSQSIAEYNVYIYNGVYSGTIDLGVTSTTINNVINIKTISNSSTESIDKSIHNGTPNSGAKIDGSINITQPFTTVSGLIVDGGTSDAITIAAAEGVSIRRCVVLSQSNGIIIGNGTSDNNHIVSNSIIIDCTTTGIIASDANSMIVNNTVYNCGTGVSSPGSIINCISSNSTTCYSGSSIYNCISSDATGDIPNVNVSFVDSANLDLHIKRTEWNAINSGAMKKNSLEAAKYGIYSDIDMNITKDRVTIGADTIGDIKTKRIKVSIGSEHITIYPTAGAIYKNVLTLDFDQRSHQIGEGDIITCSGVDYVIRDVISNNKFILDNSDFSDVDLDVPVTLEGIRKQYTKISDAFTGVIASLNGVGDLSKAMFALDLAVYNGSITDSVVLSGLITDYDHCVSIYSPKVNVLKPQGHYGFFGKGVMITPSGANCIETTIEYTKISGLSFNMLPGAGIAISIGSERCLVNGNIISGGAYGISSSGDNDEIINNSIMQADVSIKTSSNAYVINNTALIFTTGYEIASGAVVMNCIANSSVSGATGYTSGAYISNCIDNTGTLNSENGNIQHSEAFKDLSSLYTIDASSKVHGNGNSEMLSEIPELKYDITGVFIRRPLFDIGAYKFVVPNDVYVSVGNQNDKTELPLGVSSIVLNVDVLNDDISIGHFSTPLTNKYVSSGDVITTDSDTYILQEKISKDTWKMYTDGSGSDLSLNVRSIKCKYSNIQQVVDPGYNGRYTINIVKTYYDNYTQPSTPISMSTSGYTYNNCSRLMSSDGNDGLSNWSQRNVSGVKAGDLKSTGLHVNVVETPIEITGIMIECDTASAINLTNCQNITLSSNLFVNVESVDYSKQSSYVNIANNTNSRTTHIYNNIMHGSRNDMITIVNDYKFNKNILDVAVNGDSSDICIVNNSFIYGGTAINIRNKNGVYNTVSRVYNNIFDSQRLTSISIDKSTYGGDVSIFNNLSTENGPNEYVSSLMNSVYRDICFVESNPNEDMSFFLTNMLKIDRDGGGTVDTYIGNSAIGSCMPIDNRMCMPVDVDANGKKRNIFWDFGALETQQIIGFSNMNSPYPFITSETGSINEINDSCKLYLRKPGSGAHNIDPNHILSYIDINLQWSSITDINTWIADINNEDCLLKDLIIYCEGGIVFDGVFELLDRGVKSVTITTMPEGKGPSYIAYDDTLFDSNSVQGEIVISHIVMYSKNGTSTSITPSDAANDTRILITNSAIELDSGYLTTHNNYYVNVVNSSLVYRDAPQTAGLSSGTQPINTVNMLVNSNVLSNSPGVVFDISYSQNLNVIDYSSSYNFSGDSFELVKTHSSSVVIEGKDPKYNSLYIPSGGFDSSIVMRNSLSLDKKSPLINAGNNMYVDSGTDIYGGSRVYLEGAVDIGPTEEKIVMIDIDITMIRSIEQKKLYVDNDKDMLYSIDYSKLYYDAYSKFDDTHEAEKFTMESNVLIELKNYKKRFTTITDKLNTLLVKVKAVLDESKKTIIIQKNESYNSDFLSNAFEDGRYLFNFNELDGYLYVYINNTYDKGISGKSNIVNNVRFSGTRMLSE